jgi:hypothetical protein
MTEKLRPGMVVIAKGGWNFADIKVGDLLLLVALHDHQPREGGARWIVMKADGGLATISWVFKEHAVQVVPSHGINTSPTNEAL